MRQQTHPTPTRHFSFWSRDEVLRLGVIALACAVPLMMPEARSGHARVHTIGVETNSPAMQSSGRLRTVRMSPFNLSKDAALSLGDVEETN